MQLTSLSFQHCSDMPQRLTGEGGGLSPHLAWSDVPDGTQSFLLIARDGDAPLRPVIIWKVAGIESACRELKEGTGKEYEAPAPRNGSHRYYFNLYALNNRLEIQEKDWDAIQARIKDHVLAEAELIGIYTTGGRKPRRD